MLQQRKGLKIESAVGFLFFLGLINLKPEISENIPQYVLIFRFIQVVLKILAIFYLFRFLNIRKGIASFVFWMFVVLRTIYIDFSFKELGLSIEYFVTILLMLCFVNWKGLYGLKYLVYPLIILTFYQLIGSIIFPESFFVKVGNSVLLQSKYPALNANRISQISLIIYIFSLHKLPKYVSLIVMLMSRSRASIGFFVYYIFRRHGAKILPLVVILGVVLLFYATWLSPFLTRGQSIEELLTLSSRTLIWKSAFALYQGNILFGSGSHGVSFELMNIMETELSFQVLTIDNSFLTIFIENGLTGLCALLFLCYRAACNLRMHRTLFWLFSFLLFRGFSLQACY